MLKPCFAGTFLSADTMTNSNLNKNMKKVLLRPYTSRSMTMQQAYLKRKAKKWKRKTSMTCPDAVW